MIVNIHDAKTHLSRLLERVAAGEEVTIARAGRPVARLVPIHTPQRPRVSGQYRGKIRLSDDFDAPLPGELLDAFEGKALEDAPREDTAHEGKGR